MNLKLRRDRKTPSSSNGRRIKKKYKIFKMLAVLRIVIAIKFNSDSNPAQKLATKRTVPYN